MSKKPEKSAFSYVAYITQVGLQLVIPILLCLIVSVFLRDKFSLGNWVVVVGILLGIGAAYTNLIKFVKYVTKDLDEDDEENERY